MQPHAATTPPPGQPGPRLVHDITCPDIPAAGLFALIRPQAGALPAAFANLPALARHIHRARGGDALQLMPERLRFRDQVRDTVAVVAEHPVSGETRLIGHAWIRGRDWRALEAALEAAAPQERA